MEPKFVPAEAGLEPLEAWRLGIKKEKMARFYRKQPLELLKRLKPISPQDKKVLRAIITNKEAALHKAGELDETPSKREPDIKAWRRMKGR